MNEKTKEEKYVSAKSWKENKKVSIRGNRALAQRWGLTCRAYRYEVDVYTMDTFTAFYMGTVHCTSGDILQDCWLHPQALMCVHNGNKKVTTHIALSRFLVLNWNFPCSMYTSSPGQIPTYYFHEKHEVRRLHSNTHTQI